jgi:hypothetical protein
MKLPEVKISSLEVSDLFFNYAKSYNTTEENARDFLNFLPSVEKAGITVKMLVEDYNNRE